MNRVVPFAPQRPGVDLAFEPDFSLGSALVRPSRHEVLIGGRCETLEPRVMQVLVVLGRAEGETVTRDELIRRCWDGRIVSDDAINRAVSKIRALAQLGDGASFRIETRPRLGYRLFAQDAPPRQEQSNHLPTEPTRLHTPGSSDEDDVAGHPETVGHARQWIIPALVGLVLVGIAAFMALRGSGAQRPVEVKLAGFTSLSPEIPAALPASLREELLSTFGADAAVTLFSGDGARQSHPFALSGTIRKVEERVRFTLKLENSRTGAVLLTESVDRPLSQLAIAPRQAAVSLSQVVRCGLSGAAQHRRPLPDSTLTLYFQFCQELWSGSSDDETRAMYAARRITVATPEFARGWSGLAASVGYAVREGTAANISELRAEGMAAAGKAIRLDPEISQAWAARGNLLPTEAYAAREEMYRKAVSVRPTDCSCERQDYGHFLASVGRWEDAIEQFQRGHDMQPLGATANSSVAGSLAAAGRDEEAWPIIEAAIGLWPDRMNLRRMRLRIALWSGRHEEALRLIADPVADFSGRERAAWTSALEAIESGDPALRKRAAAQVQALTLGPRPGDSLNVSALAALGETRAALAAAERLVPSRGNWKQRVLFEPTMARMRHEPSFAVLVEKLGLIDYWRKSGHKPDFCREAKAPRLCRTLG